MPQRGRSEGEPMGVFNLLQMETWAAILAGVGESWLTPIDTPFVRLALMATLVLFLWSLLIYLMIPTGQGDPVNTFYRGKGLQRSTASIAYRWTSVAYNVSVSILVIRLVLP